MSPAELMAWEGWERLQAVAVAPDEATMVLGDKESTLDFFVIREVLRPLLGRVFVDHRFATRPRRAVALEIGGNKSIPLARCHLTPASYWTTLPPPVLPPAVPDWGPAAAAVAMAEEEGSQLITDVAYKAVVETDEEELENLQGL